MSSWKGSRFRLVSATALAGSFFIPLATANASQAAGTRSITISGSVSGIPGGRVLVLSAQGVGWTGVIRGTSFKVIVPAKDRARLVDATVQVVAASGSYVGPVVLKKMVEKKNPACGSSTRPVCLDDVLGLGKASGNVSLGRLVGENVVGAVPTWFLASRASSVDVLTKRDRALMEVLASAAVTVIEPGVQERRREAAIRDRLQPVVRSGGPNVVL